MRSQFGGKEDGCRTICPTDDTDRTCLCRSKAHRICAEECNEDTYLRGCTEDQRFGISNEWTEIRHGTHTDEDQAGIDSRFDAYIEDVEQTTLFEDRAVGMVSRTLRIEEGGP